MSEVIFTHETIPYRRSEPIHLWLLRGPLGVVQFKAGPHRRDCDICPRFRDISHFDLDGRCWQAWDLGYHSPRPKYEGHDLLTGACEILGGPCYYDGTGLGAGELLDDWFAHGASTPWLEEQLRGWYRAWLETDDEVFASPVTALAAALDRAVSEDGAS